MVCQTYPFREAVGTRSKNQQSPVGCISGEAHSQERPTCKPQSSPMTLGRGRPISSGGLSFYNSKRSRGPGLPHRELSIVRADRYHFAAYITRRWIFIDAELVKAVRGIPRSPASIGGVNAIRKRRPETRETPLRRALRYKRRSQDLIAPFAAVRTVRCESRVMLASRIPSSSHIPGTCREPISIFFRFRVVTA